MLERFVRVIGLQRYGSSFYFVLPHLLVCCLPCVCTERWGGEDVEILRLCARYKLLAVERNYYYYLSLGGQTLGMFLGLEAQDFTKTFNIRLTTAYGQVDFWQPSGALITNTVSDGTELDGVALNMTYTFEWRVEGVAEGSEEAAKLFKQYTEGAKMAVHSSIVAMREMAANRELD